MPLVLPERLTIAHAAWAEDALDVAVLGRHGLWLALGSANDDRVLDRTAVATVVVDERHVLQHFVHRTHVDQPARPAATAALRVRTPFTSAAGIIISASTNS